MNVLISTNDRGFTGAEVVIYSLMRFHKNVHWYVLTMTIDIEDTNSGRIYHYDALSKEERFELRKIVKYFDSDSTIEIINVGEKFIDTLACGPNDLTPFTPYTALRLLADQILPENESRLLYLDVDTIVMQNIESDYYKYTNIDSPYAAYVVPDACDYKGEMVAGVLFFNMDICRKTGFFKTACNYYKTREYKFPDQMAIRDTADPAYIEEALNYMYPFENANFPIKIAHFSNKLVPKVYGVEWEQFFKKFPQFIDIKEGIELINSLNFNIIS